MNEPSEPGYWWYEDNAEESIWLVMPDGGITDGAYIYSRDEFDGKWTPVQTPEEIEAALEKARAEGKCEAAIEVYDDDGYYGGPPEHEPITPIELTFTEYIENLADAKAEGAAEEQERVCNVLMELIDSYEKSSDVSGAHGAYDLAWQDDVRVEALRQGLNALRSTSWVR